MSEPPDGGGCRGIHDWNIVARACGPCHPARKKSTGKTPVQLVAIHGHNARATLFQASTFTSLTFTSLYSLPSSPFFTCGSPATVAVMVLPSMRALWASL